MPAKQLVFANDGLDLRKFPDLMPKRIAGIFLEFSTAPPAGGRFAGNDVLALDGRNQLAEMSLATFLSALLPFISGLFLRFWLAVRMLGTRRQRRVSRGRLVALFGKFLDLIGKRLGLHGQRLNLIEEHFRSLGQRLDQVDQRNDEGFDGRRHLGFDFGRDLDSGWSVWHTPIGAENGRPSPDRFFKSLHRPVNGYSAWNGK